MFGCEFDMEGFGCASGELADIHSRYVTIVRFDPAYHTLFRCNLKMIRHDYPHIQKWLMHVYYDNTKTKGAFRETTYFDAVSLLITFCESVRDVKLTREKRSSTDMHSPPNRLWCLLDLCLT